MNSLKLWRNKSNLTLREVADYLKITEGSACLHEKGTRNPSIKQLKKLATLYGCTVDELIE